MILISQPKVGIAAFTPINSMQLIVTAPSLQSYQYSGKAYCQPNEIKLVAFNDRKQKTKN
jgi:hypothetical protein